MNPKANFLIAKLAAAAAVWMAVGAPAQADTTARTDDKSVSAQTAWYTVTNQTTAQITTLLNNTNSRLTDIEVYGTDRYTVTMVANTGNYAVPGWVWYVGQTFDQVSAIVNAGNRLIDIEPYATAAGTRFAIIAVANSGTTARGFTWGAGASQAFVDNLITTSGQGASPQRLTHLQPYQEGGVTKYAFIGVTNTGTDAKAWQYFYNQPFSGIGARLNAFNGRLVSLGRRSNGNYDIVLVKNSAADTSYASYYGGLTSYAQTTELASQYAARMFDVETYSVGGVRYYDALFISNTNAETARMRGAIGSLARPNGLPNGQWAAYVKPVGSAATQSLNGSHRFEPASAIKSVHNLHTMRRVQAGTDTLNSAFTYYNYPSDGAKGFTGNACPDPIDETASNRVISDSLGAGRNVMMSNSDNRTTRGVTLRYGLPAIQSTAFNTVGMTDTFIQQDRIGCGYVNNKKNLTTLVDLGKLYEGVQNGTLLGPNDPNNSNDFVDQFFAPMNGGFATSPDCSSSNPGACYTNDIRTVVSEEAAKLGKQALASDFISRMDWRHKGGSYSISCTGERSGATALCSKGYILILTEGGRITLPRRNTDGSLGAKSYVFGNQTADVNVCDVNGSGDRACSVCPECVTVLQRDTFQRKLRKEQFRAIIRDNLLNY